MSRAGCQATPIGNKASLRWEAADENGNVGWVMNAKLAPSN